jgi:hypothetical protein
LGPSIFLQQLLGAPEGSISVLELRLGLRDRRLLEVDRRLKRRALKGAKQVAPLDIRTFDKSCFSKNAVTRATMLTLLAA